nr:hypothetical protein [Tanacetum cinerariifolium]
MLEKRFETYVKAKDLDLWHIILNDEPASPVRDVSEGEACPTESGFIADQDRATITMSSTLPHDSAPRVTSPAADKGSVPATQSGDDALIKGRSINEGKAGTERISNDSEEIARVLTSIDAATVLAGGIDVPTGSGFIPTVGPPTTVISTGSEGKEVMVESDTPKKKKLQEQIDAQVARELEEQQEKENMRMNEQIARDTEVARIHAEEELPRMIDSLDKSNDTIAKVESEWVTPKAHLPYGMFLTGLFQHVMEHYLHHDNGIYDVVERVMRDDNEDDGASRASTSSPTTYINSLRPLDYQPYNIPTTTEQDDELHFERQTNLLNQTQQMHNELSGGFKSFGKAL